MNDEKSQDVKQPGRDEDERLGRLNGVLDKLRAALGQRLKEEAQGYKPASREDIGKWFLQQSVEKLTVSEVLNITGGTADYRTAFVKGCFAFADLVVEQMSTPVKRAEAALAQLTDGECMGLENTYGEILRVLAVHAGEIGTTEGAYATLLRIIRERDGYKANLAEYVNAKSAEVPTKGGPVDVKTFAARAEEAMGKREAKAAQLEVDAAAREPKP